MTDRLDKILESNGLPALHDLDTSRLRPSLHSRSPLYHAYLYPLFGIYRLATDLRVAKPILLSTFVALLQSGIVTAGYVYFSFPYVHWFVTHHLLAFTYFNLRPVLRAIEYITGSRVSVVDMEWYTAGILTLFQAAVLANALVGYRLRVQGVKAGTAVLSTGPGRSNQRQSRGQQVKRAAQAEVQAERRNGPGGVTGFIWRIVKNTMWTTFITPIYAVPVVGQVLFAFLRAPNVTRNYLSMFKAQEHGTRHNIGAIGFGIVAAFLQSVPFLGHFFVITNCVGIALWVQDLETTAGASSDAGADVHESSAMEESREKEL